MTNLSKIIKSQLTVPLTILLSALYLVADLFLLAPAQTLHESRTVSGLVAHLLPPIPPVWNATALTLVALLAGFLLLQIIDQYSLIREKSTLPFVFLVAIGQLYIGLNVSIASVATMFFLGVSYLFLFYAYQLEKSQRALFNYALFFSVASLFCIDLLWLSPLLFVALISMRVFYPKNIPAILFGLIAPYIIALFPYFIQGRQAEILPQFQGMLTFQIPDFLSWSVVQYLHTGTTFGLILLTSLSAKLGLSQDKVRVRNSFDFLLLLFLSLSALSFFKPGAQVSLHWSADFVGAYFLANYFSTKKGTFVSYLFVITLFIYIITDLLVLV
ncbi:MAG: hypothetical protein ACRC9Q_08475 [Bacteroidales bacterium]